MGKRDGDRHHSGAGLGLAAIAAAAALWSVAAVAARNLFDRGVDPIELAEARSVIAVAGLALIPAARRATARRRPGAVILLGVSIALVNAVYYMAIARLDVAVALVLQYTAPALVVLWVAATTRRRPAREVVVAVVVTFTGVVLVSGLLVGDVGRVSSAGVLFGVASSVLFATYTLLSERAGEAYGVLGALLRGFAAATVMWVAFQAPRGWPHDLFAPENVWEVLFVGTAGTLMPFILFLWGVQQVRAERAAVAATLEPILAAIVAWFWLDQVLEPIQLLGGALVLAGIVALQARRKEVMVPEL
ncbi:MAG TPA: DMT family transporter [Actinomycetota bacterium]|nr:DMT family transporter [Actinomycetota bacterium]